MAIVKVGSGQAYSTTSNGFTSGSFDTTGANFIVISLSTAPYGDYVISDSKGNTWIALTKHYNSANPRANRLYYCYNATVGTGHTFTVDGTSNFPSITIAWFSGVMSSGDPFDVENGANVQYSSSLASGNITPTKNNELCIVGAMYESNSGSFDGGFTTEQVITNTDYGKENNALGYKIQTVKESAGSTITPGGSSTICVSIASFKSAGGPIAFRSVASYSASSSSTIVVNKPTGTIQGDVMVAFINYFRNNSVPDANPTAPSGWTLIGSGRHGYWGNIYGQIGFAYYKVAGASEPSDYTWTLSASGGDVRGVIASYSGVDNTTPIHAETGADNDSGVDPIPGLAITTTISDCWVVACYSIPGHVGSLTGPSNLTYRAATTDGTVCWYGDTNIEISAQTFTPGDMNIDQARSNGRHTIALKAEPAAASSKVPNADHSYRQRGRN